MSAKGLMRYILSLSFLYIFLALFYAYENTGKLKVKGRIQDPVGNNLDSVTVTLKEFDKVLLETVTSSNGKFTVECEFQKKMTLHFDKEGYVSMYMQIDSEIPLPKSDKNFVFSPQLNMLSDTMTQFNLNVFERPITRIVFDPVEDVFVEDQSALDEFVAETNEPEGVIFLGSIRPNDSTKIDSATVEILEKEEVVSTLPVDSLGNFRFKVFYNKEATVQISAEDFHPTKFTVNTKVPDSLLKEEFEVKPTIPMVSKKTEYINAEAFRKPVAQFEFTGDSANFAQNPGVKKEFYKVLDEPKQLPIDITGTVVDSAGKPLTGVDVMLKDKDSVLASMRSKADGSYALKAPFDKDMYLAYNSKDHHQAVVEVNTERQNDEFKKVEFKAPPIKLYKKEDAYVDPKVFEKPVNYLEYRDSTGSFVEDEEVTKEFNTAVEKSKEKNAPKVALANEKYPQEYDYLYIKGELLEAGTGEDMEGANITVRVGNVEYKKVKTDNRGKFELELEYLKEYNIEFSKEGFYPMHFDLDSWLPESERDNDFTHKIDEIELFGKDYQDYRINPNAFEMPFTKIYYDTLAGKFVDDASVIMAFGNRLNTPEKEMLPDVLVLNGRVQDYSRRRHKDLQVFVQEDETNVDTLELGREGQFKTQVDYNKNYDIVFESPDHYTSRIAVNTNFPGQPEIDTASIGDVKTYAKDGHDVDPMVFQTPVKRIAFNTASSEFGQDTTAVVAFNDKMEEAKLLAEIATKRLTVSGMVRNLSEERLKNVMVYLVEGNQKLDSTETNWRGEFEMDIPFQKDAVLQFKGEGHYRSFVDLNTTMPRDSIENTTAVMPLVTLVPENTQDIDSSALAMPNQKMYYSARDNTFVVDSAAKEGFIAKLMAPKREKERQLAAKKAANTVQKITPTAKQPRQLGQLTVDTEVEERAIQAELPNEEELMSLLDSQFAIAEKDKEESIAEKSATSTELMMTMNSKDTIHEKIDIKNEMLSADFLDDVEIKEIEEEEDEEVDQNIQQQQEQIMEFNEILARSLVMRRGSSVDSISVDSVFSVDRPVRISRSEQGKGIFITRKVDIIANGELIEMVHMINWFVIDDYYRNNESISEQEYLATIEQYENKEVKN